MGRFLYLNLLAFVLSIQWRYANALFVKFKSFYGFFVVLS